MLKVKFTLAFQGNCKVKAIKAVRRFTGLGLKEAKDYVERDMEPNLSWYSHVQKQPIIVSMAQFGVFMAHYHITNREEVPEVFLAGAIEYVYPNAEPVDFSNREPLV